MVTYVSTYRLVSQGASQYDLPRRQRGPIVKWIRKQKPRLITAVVGLIAGFAATPTGTDTVINVGSCGPRKGDKIGDIGSR